MDIPIKLDLTFILAIPIVGWFIGDYIDQHVALINSTLSLNIVLTDSASGIWPWGLGCVVVLGLFVCVLLHELGHLFAARHYDVSVETIKLWIFGGVAQLPDYPEDWHQNAIIAIAGPLVSFVVGGACYLVLRELPVTLYSLRFIVGYLALMNLVLAAFNLLPGLPLDGGQLLRALLMRTRSFVEATRIAARVGMILAAWLALVGLLIGNFILAGLALILYLGAIGETRQAKIKETLDGVTVRDVMTTTSVFDEQTVPPDMSVAELLQRMFNRQQTECLVSASNEPLGVITLDDALKINPVETDAYTAADVMRTNFDQISVDSEARDAFTTFQRTNTDRLLVTDKSDIVGVLSQARLKAVIESIDQSRVPGSISKLSR